MPARVWLYVGVVWAAALGFGILAFSTVASVRVPAGIPWPWITLGMLAVQMLPVRLHIREQTQSIDLFGVAALLGMVFTPLGDLLLAATAATVLRGLLRRDPMVRTWFNTANQVWGVAVARLAFGAMLGHASPITPVGWLVLCGAMIAYEAVTHAGVLGVMTLADKPPDRRYLHELYVQTALILPVNAAIAIIAVAVCWSQPWVLLLLTGLILVLSLWYRSANRLRTRFEDVQSLYGFSMKLTEVSERGEVLGVALEQTRVLLRCQRTSLSVPEPEEAYRYTLDPGGQLCREHVEMSSLESQVLTTRVGRVTDKVIAVPVAVGDGKTAVLVAADPEGDSTAFDQDDLRLFKALAAHLATALTSSRRLDLLRHEVAAREHEAFHDSLTGLANRSLFSQVVTTALSRRKASQKVAVLIMDLDGFKEINDTLGHHTGDAILQEIGTRVGLAVGADRLAARLGGDEFAFVIPGVADAKEVTDTAEAILQTVSQPMTIGSMVLRLRASMGVALAPVHGTDPSSLLKRADVAMYSAKSSSRGVMIYDPKIDRYSTRRLVLASELQRAVAASELEVWYQPVANLSDGRIVGFEALMRWNHSEYGAVSPVEFIPVAEQTGLIEPLTWFVLRTALTELRAWHRAGYDLDMAVNVSARSLLDTEIVSRLRGLLTELGVDPHGLVLEVTESSMMVDSDRAERVLRQLSDLGVKIAIDDFGTGYSSLSRLKVMPVQLVKVDRSFVQHMCHDAGDAAIVRSTIELARNMGHLVVAEGVEDTETWDRLAEMGCDFAQGYLMSPALPAPRAREWLSARQTPSRAPVVELFPAAVSA